MPFGDSGWQLKLSLMMLRIRRKKENLPLAKMGRSDEADDVDNRGSSKIFDKKKRFFFSNKNYGGKLFILLEKKCWLSQNFD